MSASAAQRSGGALRHEKRLLWLHRIGRMFLVLAIIFWSAWGVLYRIEWSIFTTSAVRPHIQPAHHVPQALPAGVTIVERDECHYMVGHGGLFISGGTPYSASFAQTWIDAASTQMAWDSLDDLFPRWYALRYYWQGPNRIVGVRFLPLAALATFTWATLTLIRLRQVPPGHCLRCRYDLRGSGNTPATTTICPECGTRTV